MFRLCLVAVALAVANAASFENKIVNGQVTTIGELPYQVSLQVYNQHICGGSIISNKHIITAAHCTDGMGSYPMSIRAGSSFHSSGGQVISVSEVSQHAWYDSKTYDYDLSILTLSHDLKFGPSVQPIPLASSEPLSGVATVSGWGHTSENGEVSLQLRSLAMPIIPRSSCKQILGNRLTNNMICAGYANGGRDACQGDSGGPLAMNGELVGVVSWGIGCARPHIPGIYTNVAKLLSKTVSFA